MGVPTPEDVLRAVALQDQEVAAGVDWLEAHLHGTPAQRQNLVWLYDVMNGPDIRRLRKEASRAELSALCSLAMIGLHEVIAAHRSRSENPASR